MTLHSRSSTKLLIWKSSLITVITNDHCNWHKFHKKKFTQTHVYNFNWIHLCDNRNREVAFSKD